MIEQSDEDQIIISLDEVAGEGHEDCRRALVGGLTCFEQQARRLLRELREDQKTEEIERREMREGERGTSESERRVKDELRKRQPEREREREYHRPLVLRSSELGLQDYERECRGEQRRRHTLLQSLEEAALELLL